ncbi:uncharacterized protein LOC132757125 [Ruditapes philippinarum]|uniref:uncharacterized protein LOC132757125 n=1 Tax=Ruditapes philippinarum TaxID=129788 RepID=UPI00295A5FC9|nr:uncharacterized protein LOC132757125 [Ruditapes philippinarum]
MAEDVANVANKYMEDTNMKCTVDELDFIPDKTILSQVKQNIALGPRTKTSTKYASSLFQIRRDKSYCVKVKSDTEDCYISSACCLKNGSILLADHNNKKLKQIRGYNYTVTDYYDLPEQPWQVCSISKTDVALTLPLQHEVHFISGEEKMKRTNKIKTDFECYGLAYTNNNLYISDASTSVYVYTLSGTKLQHFSETQSGQKLFSNIHSIAVSTDGARIYVADFYNGLIVLDNNGQVITTSNGEQFCGANCCYITKAGSMLVSTYGSSVLQFTPDGELIGEVIKADSEGRSEILSVCCNQQMSRMFVCSIDDNIGVYGI